jgi:hypothetical protein
MSALSQEFVFTAIEAENNGEQFPVDFDDIWETFGYSKKANARRYITIRSGLKAFTSKGLLQMELSYILCDNDKIKLSFDSYKFALARANTAQGTEYLLYLISIEKQYRKQLESLFKQESSDRDELINALNNAESELLTLQQKLHQSQLDHQNFCFTSRFLHQVSGIVNFSQVKSAIKRDFVEGRDWILVENEIHLNESTFNILTVSFRSLRGTNISCLPEIIKLETQLYFQYQEQRRKNRRINQCDCDGQIALNLEVQ